MHTRPPRPPPLCSEERWPFPDMISCGLRAREEACAEGMGGLPGSEPRSGFQPSRSSPPPAPGPGRKMPGWHAWVPPAPRPLAVQVGAGGAGKLADLGEARGQACGSPGSVLQGSDLTAEAFQGFPPEEPPRVLFVLLAGLGSGQRARRGHGRKGLEDRRQPLGLTPLSGEEPRRGDSRGHGQVRDGLGFELGSSRCPEDTGPFPAHLPHPRPRWCRPCLWAFVGWCSRGRGWRPGTLGIQGGLESEPQGNWTSLATPYLRVQTRRL